jgi:hypothetical protein
MKYSVSFVLNFLLLASIGAAGAETAQEPVYIYVYARVTDQVNVNIAEDQLRRLLPMVETYRKESGGEHLRATVLFSGAVSEALAQRNKQTHILDFVKDYIRRGVIEAGYDGWDEPTFEKRPLIDFTRQSTAQDRWMLRKTAAEKFLVERRDPVTGAPESGTTGGLKEMQAVFGEAACITGLTQLMKMGPDSTLTQVTSKRHEPTAPTGAPAVAFLSGLLPEVGGDTEAAIAMRRFNANAIMFGISDDNPAGIPGFRGAREGFSRAISPIPETAPEVYWQDNVLRSSETSGPTAHLIHLAEGLEATKTAFDKLDRSKVHVIHVQLATELNYLRPEFSKGANYPPLKYAYDHPQDPKLPAEAWRVKSEVDAAYASENAALKWLSEDFLPGNPGSRFVSSSDLTKLTPPSSGFAVSMAAFRSSLAEFMKNWGNDTYAPSLFQTDGHYLSRAEVFQVMSDALAEFDRTGKIPDSIKVDEVYGPVRLLTGHGPNTGEVSVASVIHKCSEIAPGLHDKSSGTLPNNSIPIGITLEGTMLNPAQFLRLMGLALLNPSSDAKLNIRMSYVSTALGDMLPKSRPAGDNGFVWTLKPAPLGNLP